MNGLTGRSSTGCWAVESGPTLVGPFDGHAPARAFATRMRKAGVTEVKLRRLWLPEDVERERREAEGTSALAAGPYGQGDVGQSVRGEGEGEEVTVELCEVCRADDVCSICGVRRETFVAEVHDPPFYADAERNGKVCVACDAWLREGENRRFPWNRAMPPSERLAHSDFDDELLA